jgi:hypothetical protein
MLNPSWEVITMTDSSTQAGPCPQIVTNVVLLAPELFTTPPNPAALQGSLTGTDTPVRLLIRLATPTDMALAESLANAGVAVQVLVPAGLAAPSTTLPVARMPPGSSEAETNELALALSDILLAPETPPEVKLVRLARALNKPLVVPGEPPPPLPAPPHSITHHLDPEQPGLHSVPRRHWGRLEQFLLELAAFNWQGTRRNGIARSLHRLRANLFARSRTYTSYFAPDGWAYFAPDRAARDPKSPIVAGFDRLDRSALYGAYIHRDLAWAAYLAAAYAVLFTVVGHIGLIHVLPDWLWPIAELVALIIVLAATIFARRSRLQERWTACRFAAEQVRIARMCLPLLVTPRALSSEDRLPRRSAAQQALDEVKRIVRDQGLPDLSPAMTAVDAARWVRLLVADQATYHRHNHRKLHCTALSRD